MKASVFLLIAAAIAPAVVASESPAPADYVPCRVQRNTPVTFPTRLLHRGVVQGDVTLVQEIDSVGNVTDRLVTAYSHPELAAEVIRATKDWKYQPGTHNGQPVVSILTMNFEFSVRGVLVYEKYMDTAKPEDNFAGRFAYFAHGASTLDRMPAAKNASGPVYPRNWIEEGRRGHVTVRFYIDETGRTRLPIAIATSDDKLAAAAMAAVKDWQFAPPTAAGKPVLAYAEQDFVFQPPPLASAR